MTQGPDGNTLPSRADADDTEDVISVNTLGRQITSGPTRRQDLSFKSRHGDIAERLRLLILDGSFEPGRHISEKELTERFNVSRTPVREALKGLASEGLIRLTPNRGAFVTEVSAGDLDETFQVMGALEALAGELAARNMSDHDIAHLATLHAAMMTHYAARRLGPYFVLNQQIHNAILEGAGNFVLVDQYRQLAARMRLVRFRATMSEARWAQAVSDHEEILAALKARDGQRLSRILRSHLDGKWATVRESIDGAHSGA